MKRFTRSALIALGLLAVMAVGAFGAWVVLSKQFNGVAVTASGLDDTVISAWIVNIDATLGGSDPDASMSYVFTAGDPTQMGFQINGVTPLDRPRLALAVENQSGAGIWIESITTDFAGPEFSLSVNPTSVCKSIANGGADLVEAFLDFADEPTLAPNQTLPAFNIFVNVSSVLPAGCP